MANTQFDLDWQTQQPLSFNEMGKILDQEAFLRAATDSGTRDDFYEMNPQYSRVLGLNPVFDSNKNKAALYKAMGVPMYSRDAAAAGENRGIIRNPLLENIASLQQAADADPLTYTGDMYTPNGATLLGDFDIKASFRDYINGYLKDASPQARNDIANDILKTYYIFSKLAQVNGGKDNPLTPLVNNNGDAQTESLLNEKFIQGFNIIRTNPNASEQELGNMIGDLFGTPEQIKARHAERFAQKTALDKNSTEFKDLVQEAKDTYRTNKLDSEARRKDIEETMRNNPIGAIRRMTPAYIQAADELDQEEEANAKSKKEEEDRLADIAAEKALDDKLYQIALREVGLNPDYKEHLTEDDLKRRSKRGMGHINKNASAHMYRNPYATDEEWLATRAMYNKIPRPKDWGRYRTGY